MGFGHSDCGNMDVKCPLEHLVPSCWLCAVEPLGGGALLQEVHHWAQTLKVYDLSPLPFGSLRSQSGFLLLCPSHHNGPFFRNCNPE